MATETTTPNMKRLTEPEAPAEKPKPKERILRPGCDADEPYELGDN